MTVSDLNFGDGSWEDARGMIRQLLSDHEATIHGNGREGMLTTFNSFLVEYRTDQLNHRTFQDTRDKENARRENRRWNILTVVLSIFGLLLTGMIGFEASRQFHGNFTSTTPNTVSSSSQPQNASQ